MTCALVEHLLERIEALEDEVRRLKRKLRKKIKA